jgi:hypothetical protein
MMSKNNEINVIFGGAENGFGNNGDNVCSSPSITTQNNYYNNTNEYIEALVEIATTFLKVLLTR